MLTTSTSQTGAALHPGVGQALAPFVRNRADRRELGLTTWSLLGPPHFGGTSAPPTRPIPADGRYRHRGLRPAGGCRIRRPDHHRHERAAVTVALFGAPPAMSQCATSRSALQRKARWATVRARSDRQSPLIFYSSLGDRVMLGTAWIDRPVDTQGCAPCFHVLLSAAWKRAHAQANDRRSSRVFAMPPRGFARTTRNG
jgi:hypothetical protein